MTHNDPYLLLGIPLEAGDEEIRAAYLRKVKEYPPDRAPREFEKVRDAYEVLRDPRRRTRHLLLSADPKQPLVALLEGGEGGGGRYYTPHSTFTVCVGVHASP